jgi:hypothetical protein
VLGERELQALGLACRRAGSRRQGRIDRVDRRAVLDHEIEVPLGRVTVAEGVHLGELLAGVDVHDRERDAAEERLAGDPDHHVGILAERPQQRDPLHAGEALAEDEDALRFELVQPIQDTHSSSPSDRP